jgi:hypothetical protein
MAFWHAFFRTMATTRARRIGRREAEELLSGARTSADRKALIRLLHLASAPAQPDELFGIQPALQAFTQAQRDARYATTPRHARRRRSGLSVLSRALVIKTSAGLAVLLLGGTAVAATTGNLPPDVQHSAHNLLSPLGVVVPDSKAPHTARGRPRWIRPSPSPSTAGSSAGSHPSVPPHKPSKPTPDPHVDPSASTPTPTSPGRGRSRQLEVFLAPTDSKSPKSSLDKALGWPIAQHKDRKAHGRSSSTKPAAAAGGSRSSGSSVASS